MGVNENEGCLEKCVASTSIAIRARSYREGCVFKPQKRKNPLSRVSVKFKVVTVNLNWCPEEDSNFHGRKATST